MPAGEYKGIISALIWLIVMVFMLVSFYFLIAFMERSRYIDYGAQIRDMAYTTAIDCLEEFSDYQAKSRGVIRLKDEPDIEEQVVNRFNQLFRERLELWGLGRGVDEVEIELDPIDNTVIEVNRGIDPLSTEEGYYSQYSGQEDPIEGNDASRINDANLPFIKTRNGREISILIKGAMIKESQKVGSRSAEAGSVNEEFLDEGLRFRFNFYAQMQHRNLN